jgi:hypothetical protein
MCSNVSKLKRIFYVADWPVEPAFGQHHASLPNKTRYSRGNFSSPIKNGAVVDNADSSIVYFDLVD